MKRAIQYKTILMLLLLPIVMFANNDPVKGKYTKEKTIKKQFNVNSNATLVINNNYGNLDIVTWDQNRIEFEIIITTSSNNEETAQKKLDEITISFDSDADRVSAKTIFNKNKSWSRSWWKWTTSSNVNMKINYIVKMPITNNVDLDNDYGTINLAKLEGRAVIKCDYGKITTKELLADDNRITFDYSNNCFFEYIKSGKINADYSGFTVSKANKLDIIADYTKSKVEIAEQVSYNCDYGGLTVDKVNSIRGNGNYLTVRLGDIYKDVSISADYGSIRIDKLTKNVKNVTINSNYVGIKLGYDSAYAFNFDIDLEYASLKDNDDALEMTKKRIESSDKYYYGYHKNDGSGNLIKINSDYGSVSFNKL